MSKEQETRPLGGAEPGAGQSGGGRWQRSGDPESPRIGDWLHIQEDGSVTVYTGKVEVGQNIRTSLAEVVASELCVPLESVTVVMGDTELTPFDPGTFGSRTTPTIAPRLRQVAGAARELLLTMAANRWGVNPGELHVSDARVIHETSGRYLGYGELTGGRRMEEHYARDESSVSLREWRTPARQVHKISGQALVTGEHLFASDITRPNMLIGKVLRPPTPGALLEYLDPVVADRMHDVAVVREDDFLGIVARDQMTAEKAASSIQIRWSHQDVLRDGELFDYLRTHLEEPTDGAPEPVRVSVGSVREGQASADRTLETSYNAAYVAHAPPEPRAAVAEWEGGDLTVWTGTQRPFGVRSELSLALNVPEEHIRVIVPDTGSAYGGKHTGEVAIDAARLAQRVGRPVKIVWSRQEEFRHAYLRPAGVIDVASGVQSDGTFSTWEFHNYNSGGAGIRSPYDVPHQCIEFHPVRPPFRQGSYRALAATANNFARETHMDELARALRSDPLVFRLQNLSDERMRAVLETAALRFGWDTYDSAPGVGVGIACGTEKGSYLATCAEVAVDLSSGKVRVVRTVQAFECGTIINEDNVRLQNEGCIIQGLGGALFEAIRFPDGEITTDRFSRYRVPRFLDVPDIEVVLLNRNDLPPAGAGETPIIGIAPALGNAIFDAVGVRLRSLPLTAPGGCIAV